MGGITPISWVDLEAWKSVTEIDIDVSDILLMRHLSKLYVNKYHESENPLTLAPNMPKVEETNQEDIMKAMRASYGSRQVKVVKKS